MFVLKDYQVRAREAMERYFQCLSEEKQKYDKLPDEIRKEYPINYPEKVWHTLFPEHDRNHAYVSRSTGHDQPCPHFCLRIPTGGGKTLLATYAIELFQQYVRRSKTGFVLWVVPSDQIYTQTLEALKDRSHPYRERLDAISDNRVRVITKNERFAAEDVGQNLVVLVMMLQSFSRDSLKKEMLKFFQDSGRFDDFFPIETDQEKQRGLYEKFPNLDLESDFGSLLGGKVKTSFGNVVKMLQPLVILDEGHKARSDLAQSALAECNPACVCELTATPTEAANVLFSVAGRELEAEQMIKLDLNLIGKETVEWKILVSHAMDHLDSLQRKADEYRERSGINIRPINLIQVQATGQDQRKDGKIHADDVKDYLIATGKVLEDQIAIKTSSQNDIEGIDLLSDQCPIRFIITKQALQEGWDCPFAYSLTVLGGSRSESALTQLVGRVLRQPYAHKTGVKELDESYVFCLQDSAKELVRVVKNGFEYDGMGDLVDRVSCGKGVSDPDLGERKHQKVRSRYEKSLKTFKLPTFVVKDAKSKDGSRILDFTRDILPRLDFGRLDFSHLRNINLAKDKGSGGTTMAIGFARQLAADHEEFLEYKRLSEEENLLPEFKRSFWVKNTLDFIPNPWVADRVMEQAYGALRESFSEEEIARNQIFLLEELRKMLGGTDSRVGEIYRLSKEVFLYMIEHDELRFANKFDCTVLEADTYFEKEEREKLTLDKSLFEPIIKSRLGTDTLEDDFLWRIDEKSETYWWHRNKSRKEFYLVGWQKNKFYPDFIFTLKDGEQDTFGTVYLLETKGGHLLGNLDSTYKRELTETYHKDVQKAWAKEGDMGFDKDEVKTRFEFIEASDLQNFLNRI